MRMFRLVSVGKMTAVIEECTNEEQHSVVRVFFCGQRGSTKRIFIKKRFLFAVGNVCRVKRFTSGSRFSLKDVRKSQMMPDHVRKWLRYNSNKRLLCWGFRRTGKAMGQVYQCWWGICREIHVFSTFEYHMFYVLYPFVPIYWVSLVICRYPFLV
jgi:hypothetical protein